MFTGEIKRMASAMAQIFLAIAAILAGTSVGMGAFAAHALAAKLSERALEIVETAAKYQMYHALAIGLVALGLRQAGGNLWLTAAGTAFLAGVVFFSGSLYALSFSGVKVLGAITPLGGVAFMVGWGCVLAYAVTAGT